MLRGLMNKLEFKDGDDKKTAIKKGLAEGVLEGLTILGALGIVVNTTIAIVYFTKKSKGNGEV